MQGGSAGAVQEQVNLATTVLWNLLKLFEISKIDFVVWSSGPYQKNNWAAWQVYGIRD